MLRPTRFKIVPTLLVSLTLAACGGETLDSRQVDVNNGLVYKHSATEPFSGQVVFKDSIPEDLVKYWDERAKPMGRPTADQVINSCTATFVKGVLEGATTCVTADGKTVLTLGFKNEKYNGDSSLVDPTTGSEFYALSWKDGVLDGRLRQWNLKDGLITDMMMKDGKYDSGKLTTFDGAYVYKDGMKNGPTVLYDYFNNSRYIQAKGDFKDDKRVGEWMDSGQEVFTGKDTLNELFAHNPGFVSLYIDSQATSVKSNWVDGAPEGKISLYNAKGELKSEGTVTNGVISYTLPAAASASSVSSASTPDDPNVAEVPDTEGDPASASPETKQ